MSAVSPLSDKSSSSRNVRLNRPTTWAGVLSPFALRDNALSEPLSERDDTFKMLLNDRSNWKIGSFSTP